MIAPCAQSIAFLMSSISSAASGVSGLSEGKEASTAMAAVADIHFTRIKSAGQRLRKKFIGLALSVRNQLSIYTSGVRLGHAQRR